MLCSLLLFVSFPLVAQVVPGINNANASADSTLEKLPAKAETPINNKPIVILDGEQIPYEQYLLIRGNDNLESIMNLNPDAAKARYGETGKKGVIILTSKSFSKTSKLNDPDADKSVFMKAEVMPEFPGGTNALMKYIKQNLRYPQVAINLRIQGPVIVTFIVSASGKIFNVKILRSPSPWFDDESRRVMDTMPFWKPGTNKDEPVNVAFTMPIQFKLQ